MRYYLIKLFIISIYAIVAISLTSNYVSTSPNPFAKYLFESFGIAQGGLLEVEYSIHAKNESAPFTSYVVLVTFTEEAKNGWYSGPMDSPSSSSLSTICNSPSEDRAVIYGDGVYAYNVRSTNRYSVILTQCLQGNQANSINYNVQATIRFNL